MHPQLRCLFCLERGYFQRVILKESVCPQEVFRLLSGRAYDTQEFCCWRSAREMTKNRGDGNTHHSINRPIFSIEIVSHFAQITEDFPIFLKIMLISLFRPGLQKKDHGRFLEKLHRVRLSSIAYSRLETFLLPGCVRKWETRMSSNIFMCQYRLSILL